MRGQLNILKNKKFIIKILIYSSVIEINYINVIFFAIIKTTRLGAIS